MPSRLSINDTQATIGEERLSITNPLPPHTPDAIYAHLEELSNIQAELLLIVTAQERRIAELEARTWWSMLVDQLRSLWRR